MFASPNPNHACLSFYDVEAIFTKPASHAGHTKFNTIKRSTNKYMYNYITIQLTMADKIFLIPTKKYR